MKTNLLLLHGALGSAHQLLALKEILLPNFTVYHFDFSGHGKDTFQGEFSIELFEKDILKFMKQHNLEKVNIFGYSMGGYVALKFAKEYPGKVDRIITLGTKFDWTKESADMEIQMMNPDIIEKKIPKFAHDLSVRHYPNDWKLIMRKTARLMTGLANGKALKAEDFEAIPHKILISVGSDDKMVSKSESEDVEAKLQNGKLYILPGFKHPLESADIGILAGVIVDFFS